METFSTYQQNHKHLRKDVRYKQPTTPEGHVHFQIVQQQRINKVIIAPTSATATGARPIMRGNTDIWIVKGNYVIREHKRLRRAKFTPENTQCPVPTEQLDEWRQTTARRPGPEDMIYTDNYPRGSHFLGEFFPPQFWDFFPHFCFGG